MGRPSAAARLGLLGLLWVLAARAAAEPWRADEDGAKLSGMMDALQGLPDRRRSADPGAGNGTAPAAGRRRPCWERPGLFAEDLRGTWTTPSAEALRRKGQMKCLTDGSFLLGGGWKPSKYACQVSGRRPPTAARPRRLTRPADPARPQHREEHDRGRADFAPAAGCELEFSAAAFAEAFAGMTVHYVGDSVQRQMYASLRCLLLNGDAALLERRRGDCSAFTFAPAAEPFRLDGDAGPRRAAGERPGVTICSHRIVNPREGLPGLTRGGYKGWFSKFDARHVFVVNYGLAFNAGREAAYERQIEQVAAFFRQLARKRNGPLVVWREASAQHFKSRGGAYGAGARNGPASCAPWALASMRKHGNWRNDVANKHFGRAGVPILRTWLPSALLFDGHPNRHHRKASVADCTHFCAIPGGYPDLVNAVLLHWRVATRQEGREARGGGAA